MKEQDIKDVLEAIKDLGSGTSFQIAKQVMINTHSRSMMGFRTLYPILRILEERSNIIGWWDNDREYYKLGSSKEVITAQNTT